MNHGDLLAQMGDGDAVVPGQREVGAQGGAGGHQPVVQTDGVETVLQLVQEMVRISL